MLAAVIETMSDDSDGADARRKRIRQACLNCRRKKVRCGGEKPVCDFCSRLSQMCVYTEDGRSQRRGSLSFHVGEDETSNLTMVCYVWTPLATVSRSDPSAPKHFA